jgi:transketolase
MTVLAPSDAATTAMAVKAAARVPGPVYIRVGRDDSPLVFDDTYPFEIGVPVVHREGSDLSIMTTGLATPYVLQAADILSGAGVSAEIIEIHTLKPITRPELLRESVGKTGRLLTVEEHNVFGGLSTAIAEIMEGHGGFEAARIALPDIFGETGTPGELRHKYKVEPEAIAEEAQRLIREGA